MTVTKTPDSFHSIALIDRLAELGEIVKLPGQTRNSQYHVYTSVPKEY